MKVLLLGQLSSAHFLRWCRALSQASVEVVAAGFTNRGLEQTVADYRGCQVYAFRGATVIGYVRLVALARRIAHSMEPDIVHAHYASSYGLVGRLVGRHPLLISVWGSDVYFFPHRSPFHRSLLRGNLKKADMVLSTSRHMAEETLKYTSQPIRVTPFGVDTELFHPVAPRSSPDVLRIGTVKALELVYGVDILIRAFAQVAMEQRQWLLELVVVGEGTQRHSLERLAHYEGVADRVRFVGAVPHKDVPQVLRELDIFAALSRSESFGVAAIEASACGLPVVVTRTGGFPEVVVDGATGLLVAPDDVNGAARAFGVLLADAQLRKDMGKAGRAFVCANYRWDASVSGMLDVYRSVGGNGDIKTV